MIRLKEIIIYYDTIQLFIGSDRLGKLYLCILYSDRNSGDEYYLGVDLPEGGVDVRDIFTGATEYWRLSTSDGVDFEGTIIEAEEYMFPDSGIKLKK